MGEKITVPADLKVEIRDARVADRITPAGMLAYVRAHGWTFRDCNAKAELWERADDALVALRLIPLRPDVIDYSDRVLDFVRCMSEVEERSQLAVWADLRAGSQRVGQ